MAAKPKHLQIKNLQDNEIEALSDLVQFLGSSTQSKAVIEAITSHRHLVIELQKSQSQVNRLNSEVHRLRSDARDFVEAFDVLRSHAEEIS